MIVNKCDSYYQCQEMNATKINKRHPSKLKHSYNWDGSFTCTM